MGFFNSSNKIIFVVLLNPLIKINSMDIETYKKASNYEILMCRAFNTMDRAKPGIDISYMRNLIDSQNGESCVAHLPPFEKQLIKVKYYLDKAFDKLIGLRKYEVIKTPLMLLKEKVKDAETSNDLLKIIQQAIEITNDLILE
jgi:hypothetical protein